MSIDGGLRPLFHDRLRAGFHWQAVESGGTASGIPDTNFCCDGIEGWVEMKQTSAWAVGLTAEQASWHRTRRERGGRTFVAVRRHHSGGPRLGVPVDELWLCSGRWAGLLRSSGLRCTDIVWLGVWSGGPARWDWDAVRAALLGDPDSACSPAGRAGAGA